MSFHSRDTVYFRFTVAILNLASRLTSDNVGSITVDSVMVENVGVTVGISLVTAGFPHSALFHDTATIMAAILNFGSVA